MKGNRISQRMASDEARCREAGVPSLVLKFAINGYNNPATDYYICNHTLSDMNELENAFHRLINTTSTQKPIYNDLINYSINDTMAAISSIISLITNW